MANVSPTKAKELNVKRIERGFYCLKALIALAAMIL